MMCVALSLSRSDMMQCGTVHCKVVTSSAVECSIECRRVHLVQNGDM